MGLVELILDLIFISLFWFLAYNVFPYFTMSKEDREKEKKNLYYIDKRGNERWKSNGHMRGVGGSKLLPDGTRVAWDYDATSGLNVNYHIANQDQLDERKARTEKEKEMAKQVGLKIYYDYDKPFEIGSFDFFHSKYECRRRDLETGYIVETYMQSTNHVINGYECVNPKCRVILKDDDGNIVEDKYISIEEWLKYDPKCNGDTWRLIHELEFNHVLSVEYPIKNEKGEDDKNYAVWKFNDEEYQKLVEHNKQLDEFYSKHTRYIR
ncbi:hypothetical protein [Sharpea azabuensis]|uniref:hypothetical protein n=1 Tax=Sharpea azabuensis TaxID=322505 RepID=UPI002E81BF66|nr:hypothetical protein [Sharpea azabuensis]MEE3308894.1 hypothetical protein [Sharpea azabuensis]